MKVYELIEQLKACDPYSVAAIAYDHGHDRQEVHEVIEARGVAYLCESPHLPGLRDVLTDTRTTA